MLKNIEDQQQFENFISDIVAEIAQKKSGKQQEAIDSILQFLGQFFHAKLVFFGQFSNDRRKLYFTNVWPPEDIHRASCTIKQEDELPGMPDKDLFYHRLEDSEMKSGIVVPVCVQGRAIGLLGLDDFSRPCEYPLTIGDRLKTIADIIGSMIVRIQK